MKPSFKKTINSFYIVYIPVKNIFKHFIELGGYQKKNTNN